MASALLWRKDLNSLSPGADISSQNSSPTWARTRRSGRICPDSTGGLGRCRPRVTPRRSPCARHPETSPALVPVMVVRGFGEGFCMFMGIDSAWRWRRGVEDLYHYRFWGQVIRGMARKRHMARSEAGSLVHSPETPDAMSEVNVQAALTDNNGFPLRAAKVSLSVTEPTGKTSSSHMSELSGGWGLYTAKFATEAPGEYKLSAVVDTDTSRAVNATVKVSDTCSEKIGVPLNSLGLKELSTLTGGRFVRWDDASSVMREIATLPKLTPELRRYRIWAEWWWLGSGPRIAHGLLDWQEIRRTAVEDHIRLKDKTKISDKDHRRRLCGPVLCSPISDDLIRGKRGCRFFLNLNRNLNLDPSEIMIKSKIKIKIKIKISHNIIFHPNSPIEASVSGILNLCPLVFVSGLCLCLPSGLVAALSHLMGRIPNPRKKGLRKTIQVDNRLLTSRQPRLQYWCSHCSL